MSDVYGSVMMTLSDPLAGFQGHCTRPAGLSASAEHLVDNRTERLCVVQSFRQGTGLSFLKICERCVL